MMEGENVGEEKKEEEDAWDAFERLIGRLDSDFNGVDDVGIIREKTCGALDALRLAVSSKELFMMCMGTISLVKTSSGLFCKHAWLECVVMALIGMSDRRRFHEVKSAIAPLMDIFVVDGDSENEVCSNDTARISGARAVAFFFASLASKVDRKHSDEYATMAADCILRILELHCARCDNDTAFITAARPLIHLSRRLKSPVYEMLTSGEKASQKQHAALIFILFKVNGALPCVLSSVRKVYLGWHYSSNAILNGNVHPKGLARILYTIEACRRFAKLDASKDFSIFERLFDALAHVMTKCPDQQMRSGAYRAFCNALGVFGPQDRLVVILRILGQEKHDESVKAAVIDRYRKELLVNHNAGSCDSRVFDDAAALAIRLLGDVEGPQDHPEICTSCLTLLTALGLKLKNAGVCAPPWLEDAEQSCANLGRKLDAFAPAAAHPNDGFVALRDAPGNAPMPLAGAYEKRHEDSDGSIRRSLNAHLIRDACTRAAQALGSLHARSAPEIK